MVLGFRLHCNCVGLAGAHGDFICHKGVISGKTWWTTIGLFKGNICSLDYSSCRGILPPMQKFGTSGCITPKTESQIKIKRNMKRKLLHLGIWIDSLKNGESIPEDSGNWNGSCECLALNPINPKLARDPKLESVASTLTSKRLQPQFVISPGTGIV